MKKKEIINDTQIYPLFNLIIESNLNMIIFLLFFFIIFQLYIKFEKKMCMV